MFVQTCTVHIFDLWLHNFYFKPQSDHLKAKIHKFAQVWRIPVGLVTEGFWRLEISNYVQNLAFSFNHWVSDQTLLAGDPPTCLFKLVQSTFLIYGFKIFISSLVLALCKQKMIEFRSFLQESLRIAIRMALEVFEKIHDIKKLAFSFNHWVSDQTLLAGDPPTCLFKLVQSTFLIYGFTIFISSLKVTIWK